MNPMLLRKFIEFAHTDLEALPDGITGKLPLTQIVFKMEHDYEVTFGHDF